MFMPDYLAAASPKPFLGPTVGCATNMNPEMRFFSSVEPFFVQVYNIYLTLTLGFSRGAYQVRILEAMIAKVILQLPLEESLIVAKQSSSGWTSF